jgi:hypothetical protein
MPTGFHATQSQVIVEDDVLITQLGTPSIEHEDDAYLMFQQKSGYEEQDVEFGMDKPYIEYCGQGWSWYGHHLKIELATESN